MENSRHLQKRKASEAALKRVHMVWLVSQVEFKGKHG